MGTDIFMHAERRVNGRWHLVMDGAPTDGRLDAPVDLYDRRNYNLFAILADVTNVPAGTPEPQGTHYEPIAPRRGVPNDVSEELRVLWAAEGARDRASWYLLRELLEFDWYGKTVRKHAWVGPELAAAYERGYATSPYLWQWLQDIPGSDESWMRGNVPVTWVETYADSAGSDFMQGVLGRLRGYGDPEGVRIVFSFWS